MNPIRHAAACTGFTFPGHCFQTHGRCCASNHVIWHWPVLENQETCGMKPECLGVLIAEDDELVPTEIAAPLTCIDQEVPWITRMGPMLALERQHRPDLVTIDGRPAEGTTGIVAASAMATILELQVILTSSDVDAQITDLVGAGAILRKSFRIRTPYEAIAGTCTSSYWQNKEHSHEHSADDGLRPSCRPLLSSI